MGLKFVQQPVKDKQESQSCASCDHYTELEGEKLCYEHGKITRLSPCTQEDALIKLVCINWEKK